MMNKILTSDPMILSRAEAEKLIRSDFPSDTAVISFVDPLEKESSNRMPPDYSRVTDRCFPVRCYDLDPSCLPDVGLSTETYLPEAEKLAVFIKKAVKDGRQLICQCGYGQSRSAACAAAILEYYEGRGIDVFADYRYYPNQLVFNKILEALRKN